MLTKNYKQKNISKGLCGKMFNKKLIISILILISFLSITCKDEVTSPVDNAEPGRRDYKWSVDTLKLPGGIALASTIWGATSNDIWAVGPAYFNSCIWHYDGISWTNYVPSQSVDSRGLWGTSANNIWMGSSNGEFWHYDGSTWKRHTQITLSGYTDIVIQSIHGKKSDEIYAVGFTDKKDLSSYKAVLAHYDGKTWSLINLPEIKQSFTKILYDDYSQKFIINAIEFGVPKYHIYSFDGKNLTEIYLTTDSPQIYKVKEKVYLIQKSKIYWLQNNQLHLINDFSNSDFVGAMYGRSYKDFFTVNWTGIGHYNGTDLITIFPKANNDWSPRTSIIFEKEAFFIWQDASYTFIIKGKLKD